MFRTVFRKRCAWRQYQSSTTPQLRETLKDPADKEGRPRPAAGDNFRHPAPRHPCSTALNSYGTVPRDALAQSPCSLSSSRGLCGVSSSLTMGSLLYCPCGVLSSLIMGSLLRCLCGLSFFVAPGSVSSTLTPSLSTPDDFNDRVAQRYRLAGHD